MALSRFHILLLLVALLVLLPTPAAAFGAGNIASISKIEGVNWRHGDIEDTLKAVACLKGHKWSSMMIKRVYFGNWLRDYSQAVDVGTLKGVQAETIRILVWILGFMSFGYATGEFEVTAERLGVYRPEEHIDNPKDYADNADARQFDQRLRGPISPQELAIDPNTGMKNYIANEYGGWATSSGYIKHSFARAIHFGRLYTHGSNKGREEDLCEALRCLGQGLHCVEDFGAHTNYTELALRELGYHNVFPHTGTATQMNVQGKYVFPLVTGTFGGVDFLHSVLGEANDHFTQSEIDEVNTALADAAGLAPGGSGAGGASTTGKRSSGSYSSSNNCTLLTDLLGKVPGTSGLCQEAMQLQQASDQQAAMMRGDPYASSRAGPDPQQHQQPMSFAAPPGSQGGPPGPGIPGMNPNLDPSTIVPKIYPILAFRDKVVRAISSVVSKIPGLEKLIDAITERVTIFVLSLLAPFIRPIIDAASKQLKAGSSAVVDASGKHQYEPWTDPHCTDPTHSLLSKDHFSNILNEPAGQIASAILQYIAPRVVYAMDHPNVPVDQVLDDVIRVFHHPALRDRNNELHQRMFNVVERWARKSHPFDIDRILGSDSVRAGKNHKTTPSNASGVLNIPGLTGGSSTSSSHSNNPHHPPHPPSKPGKNSPFAILSSLNPASSYGRTRSLSNPYENDQQQQGDNSNTTYLSPQSSPGYPPAGFGTGGDWNPYANAPHSPDPGFTYSQPSPDPGAYGYGYPPPSAAPPQHQHQQGGWGAAGGGYQQEQQWGGAQQGYGNQPPPPASGGGGWFSQ